MVPRWFRNTRAVRTGDTNGIVIAGDHNQNISIHYGPATERLQIPFKPTSISGNIDSLLTWQSRLTPLRGRDTELDGLEAWAHENRAISLKVLCGEGGVGKTRLAFELAERLRGQGWEAGQWHHPGAPAAFHMGQRGTLMVMTTRNSTRQASDNCCRR